MVDALRDATGTRLIVEGAAPGGQVGAAYVRWPDGRHSVLTWRPRGTLADLVEPTAAVEALRRRGYPAPRTQLVEQVGDAVVVVQELLPGRVVTHLSGDLFQQALALNALQDGRSPIVWIFRPASCTSRGLAPGSACTNRSPSTATVAAGCCHGYATCGAEQSEMVADDVAHFDFQPSNMLAADGRLTGIVDWDGAGRGDRRLDLVTLRFGLHSADVDVDDGVVQRLDRLIDAMPPSRPAAGCGPHEPAAGRLGASGTSRPPTSTTGWTWRRPRTR